MTPLMIAELVLRLGPVGLDFAQKLASVWTKPALTPQEVKELCAPARKSYDDYRKEIVGSALGEVPPAKV
jgi:hypothetical protein